MGFVQRGAIRRLGNIAGWSRQRETFCVALSDPGWLAGVGIKRGVDAREVVDSDLIVIWGGNPVHTQINFMHWTQKARRERGAKLVVVDPYRTATAEKADLHLAEVKGPVQDRLVQSPLWKALSGDVHLSVNSAFEILGRAENDANADYFSI